MLLPLKYHYYSLRVQSLFAYSIQNYVTSSKTYLPVFMAFWYVYVVFGAAAVKQDSHAPESVFVHPFVSVVVNGRTVNIPSESSWTDAVNTIKARLHTPARWGGGYYRMRVMFVHTHTHTHTHTVVVVLCILEYLVYIIGCIGVICVCICVLQWDASNLCTERRWSS